MAIGKPPVIPFGQTRSADELDHLPTELRTLVRVLRSKKSRAQYRAAALMVEAELAARVADSIVRDGEQLFSRILIFLDKTPRAPADRAE